MAYHDSRRSDGGRGGPSSSYLGSEAYGSSNTGTSSYSRQQPYGTSTYPSQQQQQSSSRAYSSHHQQYPQHTPSHSHSQSSSSHNSNSHHQQSASLPSAYGYDYNLPIFPYGYPHMGDDVASSAAGGSGGDTNRGAGGAHSNGSSGGGGTGQGGDDHSPSGVQPHSYSSYYDNNGTETNANAGHSSVGMAPLPEHIESGIMSTSTWLLQPGGMPLTLEMDNDSSSTPGQAGQGQGSGNQGTQVQNDTSPGQSSHIPQGLLAVVNFASNNVFRQEDDATWRMAVDPFPFTSGLEGISGLPLDAFHAAAAAASMPPPSSMDAKFATPHAEDVKLLESYLNELVSLMEPFALSPTNPTPPPPPPFLHTRLSRLGTLVRETLASLESRSQPLLAAQFSQLPPGDIGLSEAEREMELIRRRRDVLIAKAAHAKRDGSAPVPRRPGATAAAGQQFAGGRVPVAPRPPRDVWRCAGCGATSSTEWKDGPDGPQSLCENCGYHYERLLRKRDGGDGDFSSVPAPGYDPNLVSGP